MFNLIILGLLLILIVIWICTRLKNWKQRLTFLFALIVGIPAMLFFGFKWGWKSRERKLKEACLECRQKKDIEQLHIYFMGYTEKDFTGGCYTLRKDPDGHVLDSSQQQMDTTKLNDGTLSMDYYYKLPFKNNDILEIKISGKHYILTNFVLTASANYNMGGAVVNGCRIDSADINGKRTALDQNMIIHKTDQY
ncbi:MAG: hypothetical protein LBF27_14215 [Sphingobacterium sp.]|jgi:hypothetical protein|nr:hypothetical protein [Sphingobacterium sp.]